MSEPTVSDPAASSTAFDPMPEVADATEPIAAPASPAAAPASGAGAPARLRSIDLLGNVTMEITAELGRTRMTVRDLLSLTPGTVVELDRAAGSPVDLLVNGTLVARGEVVVIDEEFGVRISEIVSGTADDAVAQVAQAESA